MRQERKTTQNYNDLEVAFIERSVTGHTLSDLLEKLPEGSYIGRTRSKAWAIYDEAVMGPMVVGEDLPQLLVEFLRGR